MTESEKILYAKTFIDKLANGINPLDDTAIPECDIVNNVRISRCLFYVSDVLKQVAKSEGKRENRTKSNKKIPFSITLDQMQSFELSDKPISATVLANKINRLADNENMQKISYRHINQWLLDIGMLEYRDIGNGKKKRYPTQAGLEMGIELGFWDKGGNRGVYPVISYSKEAQKFILDNVEAVAATEIKNRVTFILEEDVNTEV